MNPAIDLLIPIYNGRPYFDALLPDVEKARRHFKKILFYDDASKDGSADYLSGRGYEVIRSTKNGGQAFARKELLAAATSEYVHFHDMDDPLLDSFFEEMLPRLEPSQILIGRFIADFGRYSTEYHLPPSLNQGTLSLEDAYNYFIHLNSVIFPRKLMVEVGGFQPELRIHEDRFLFLSLANAKTPWKICKEALARQWCHEKNTCSTVGERFFKINWIRYFELAFKMVPASDLRFLYKDLLRISQELFREGELEMAKRGFVLCDRLGVDCFPELTRKASWFSKQFGFYQAYHLRRLFGRRIKLV